MEKSELSHRLSRITTCWSLVADAHKSARDRASEAQHQLLERYCGAIYRYLLGALRDADAADEVAQEFAYCFVRGDFKQADPERGRFRDFVKTVLFHLIVNYQRQRQKRARMGPLQPDTPEPVTPPEICNSDQEFLDRWREELLDRTWEGLAEVEKQTGHSYYQVLRFRSEHPDMPSAEMAEQLEIQPISLLRLIDRLCQQGLVERRPHPHDRRANRLYLTKKGRATLVRLVPLGNEIVADIFGSFDEHDIALLLVNLLRIRSNIRDATLRRSGAKAVRHVR